MILIVFIPLLAMLLVKTCQDYYGVNTPIFLAINHWNLGPDWLWANITFLGDGMPAFVLLAFFCRRNTRMLWLGLLAAIVTGIAAQGFKAVFDAMRPAALLAPEQFTIIGKTLRTHSFPSGHSATAFVLAGLIIKRYLADASYPKRLWAWGLALLASLIAWSRVKVGAHWPGDVLVGSVLGWYCASLVIWLDRYWPSIGANRLSCWLLYGLTIALAIRLWGFDGGYPQAIYLAKAIALAALAFIGWSVWQQKLWQKAGTATPFESAQ